MTSDWTVVVIAALGVSWHLKRRPFTNRANKNRESDTRQHKDLLWMRERRYDAYMALSLAVSVLLNRDNFVRAKKSGEELPPEMMVGLSPRPCPRLALLAPNPYISPPKRSAAPSWGVGTSPLDAASDDDYNAMVRDARTEFAVSAREALSQ